MRNYVAEVITAGRERHVDRESYEELEGENTNERDGGHPELDGEIRPGAGARDADVSRTPGTFFSFSNLIMHLLMTIYNKIDHMRHHCKSVCIRKNLPQ